MKVIDRHSAKAYDVAIIREVEFAPLDVVRIDHDGTRVVVGWAYSEDRAREIANELWTEGMGRSTMAVFA